MTSAASSGVTVYIQYPDVDYLFPQRGKVTGTVQHIDFDTAQEARNSRIVVGQWLETEAENLSLKELKKEQSNELTLSYRDVPTSSNDMQGRPVQIQVPIGAEIHLPNTTVAEQFKKFVTTDLKPFGLSIVSAPVLQTAKEESTMQTLSSSSSLPSSSLTSPLSSSSSKTNIFII